MKNSVSAISIPVSTLNAIKNMLFSAEQGGVDLSPIVNDLTIGNENADLMAINVGLTFKGIKPEVDIDTRYNNDYRDLVEYTFVSYSMIRDIVTYSKKVIAKWDSEKNDLCPCNDSKPYNDTMTYSNWLNYETDRAEPTKNLVERWAKKEEPKPQAI